MTLSPYIIVIVTGSKDDDKDGDRDIELNSSYSQHRREATVDNSTMSL